MKCINLKYCSTTQFYIVSKFLYILNYQNLLEYSVLMFRIFKIYIIYDVYLSTKSTTCDYTILIYMFSSKIYQYCSFDYSLDMYQIYRLLWLL